MPLNKRSIKKTEKTPVAPLEPETVLCVEPKNEAGKYEPLMGWCKECESSAANRRTDQLCYRCHKLANGFVFDDEKKVWVKK